MIPVVLLLIQIIAVEIEIPDTQELITFVKKNMPGASVIRKKLKLYVVKIGSKIKWESLSKDDLEQAARTALSEAASASASASASSNTKKTKERSLISNKNRRNRYR